MWDRYTVSCIHKTLATETETSMTIVNCTSRFGWEDCEGIELDMLGKLLGVPPDMGAKRGG